MSKLISSVEQGKQIAERIAELLPTEYDDGGDPKASGGYAHDPQCNALTPISRLTSLIMYLNEQVQKHSKALSKPQSNVMRACLEQQTNPRLRYIPRKLEDTEVRCVDGPFEGVAFRRWEDNYRTPLKSFDGEHVAKGRYRSERPDYLIENQAKHLAAIYVLHGRELRFLSADDFPLQATEVQFAGVSLGPAVVELAGMTVCEALNAVAKCLNCSDQNNVECAHVRNIKSPVPLCEACRKKYAEQPATFEPEIGMRVVANGRTGLICALHCDPRGGLYSITVYHFTGEKFRYKPADVELDRVSCDAES